MLAPGVPIQSTLNHASDSGMVLPSPRVAVQHPRLQRARGMRTRSFIALIAGRGRELFLGCGAGGKQKLRIRLAV